METREVKKLRQEQRDTLLNTKEVSNFIDSTGNVVKVESYERNEYPFIHFRQFRKTNILLPTKNHIIFSGFYIDEFIRTLKQVREIKNPNWVERMDVYHHEKDFMLEIEKTDDRKMYIRKLETGQDGIYRPKFFNQICFNNTRKRTKKLLSDLERVKEYL